ncbi:PGPGW domain-containing protein [Phenylobacterium sp. VNQ135]|uniref:PGPGW domain-containing protein n=1 Tax=Phenylobacterium sp. VNQ135 TaxID=3400922 RepID=UPI003C2FE2DE
MSFAMPSLRVYRATDDLAREIVARFVRTGLVLFGAAIVIAGVLIAPLPGPGGIPVIVVGLMIVLRNSFKAKRQFVKFQRAHPKTVYPIRRLLRREPEVFPVFWQQTLRVERVVLPSRFRFAVKTRRRFRRRR